MEISANLENGYIEIYKQFKDEDGADIVALLDLTEEEPEIRFYPVKDNGNLGDCFTVWNKTNIDDCFTVIGLFRDLEDGATI